MEEESFLSVIVSSTSLSLWENKVPEVIFAELRKHFEKVNSKNRKLIDTYFVRNDPRLVSCFRMFYGNNLEKCNYATIRFFHPRYLNHYKIIQQPCYRSCVYPEEVYLEKKAWIKSQLLVAEEDEDEHKLKVLIENDEVLI
jgi:hypothetical protein